MRGGLIEDVSQPGRAGLNYDWWPWRAVATKKRSPCAEGRGSITTPRGGDAERPTSRRLPVGRAELNYDSSAISASRVVSWSGLPVRKGGAQLRPGLRRHARGSPPPGLPAGKGGAQLRQPGVGAPGQPGQRLPAGKGGAQLRHRRGCPRGAHRSPRLLGRKGGAQLRHQFLVQVDRVSFSSCVR